MRKHRHRTDVIDRIEITIGSKTFLADAVDMRDPRRSPTIGISTPEDVIGIPEGVTLPFLVRLLAGKKVLGEVSGRGCMRNAYTDFGEFDDWPKTCFEIHVEQFNDPASVSSSS